MAGLITKHEFRRAGMGVYIMDTTDSAPKVEQPPPPAPTPEPVMLQPAAPAPTAVANDDSDIEELDAALVALAKIETVVRRNREVLKQFKALKVMLNNMGSGV
jgi:hypothetical protein